MDDTRSPDSAPLFSVVTIIKGRAEAFARTRDSLLMQHGMTLGRDMEWVVVNGGTKDDDVARMIDAMGETVAWSQSQKDNGLYDAMNIGLDHVKGDYVIFMNGGDVFSDKDVLRQSAELLQDNPRCDFLYGDFTLENTYHKALPLNHKWGHNTIHQSMFYKRDVIGDLRYNEKYKIHSDCDFTWNYLKHVNNPVHGEFSVCDFEGGGTSSCHPFQTAKECFAVRHKHKTVGLQENAAFTLYNLGVGVLQEFPQMYQMARSAYRAIRPKPKGLE